MFGACVISVWGKALEDNETEYFKWMKCIHNNNSRSETIVKNYDGKVPSYLNWVKLMTQVNETAKRKYEPVKR